MTLKRKLFNGSTVCVIVDGSVLDDAGLLRVASSAARAGASVIQYRDKGCPTPSMVARAGRIRAVCRKYGTPFVVNDRIDIACAARADGVHIGQGDADAGVARRLLGSGAIIGVSATTHREVRGATRAGASYIGVGPVFATPIKKGKAPIAAVRLSALGAHGIPVMAIGGITHHNIDTLVRRGMRSIAVIRAVSGSRDPFNATRTLLAKVQAC